MSGFSYDAWAGGIFYPEGLPRKEWLIHYASKFNAIELPHTFFKLPEKEQFVEWQAQVPKNFRFSVKGYQYITHVKKLLGAGEPLKLFMERVTKLRENLACVLWELPALRFIKLKTLEGFLNHLQKYPQMKHVFQFEENAEPTPAILELLQKNQKEVLRPLASLSSSEKINSSFYYLHGSVNDEIKSSVSEIQRILEAGKTCHLYFLNDPQNRCLKKIQEL